MRYVDAGYVIALCVLFVYALSLVARHRRLARAAGSSKPPEPVGGTGPHPGPPT